MRSLWHSLALRWLGGEASQSLSGEANLLDTLLFGTGERESAIYRVTRESAVSHHAMTPYREDTADAVVVVDDLRGD